MENIKIGITPQDIEGAQRSQLDNPWARALERLFGGTWYVSPRSGRIAQWTYPEYRGQLDEATLRYLRRYWETAHLAPCHFEIELTTYATDIIKRDALRAVLHEAASTLQENDTRRSQLRTLEEARRRPEIDELPQPTKKGQPG